MNTFLNDLYYAYGYRNMPEPAQWRAHQDYTALYPRLSEEGQQQLERICRSARAEANGLAEDAFRAGLDFALSLLIGVFSAR